MEGASGISKSLFSRAQGTKVLGRLGHDICIQLKLDASDLFASDFHVKVD
jgi:hypothetical protein